LFAFSCIGSGCREGRSLVGVLSKVLNLIRNPVNGLLGRTGLCGTLTTKEKKSKNKKNKEEKKEEEEEEEEEEEGKEDNDKTTKKERWRRRRRKAKTSRIGRRRRRSRRTTTTRQQRRKETRICRRGTEISQFLFRYTNFLVLILTINTSRVPC
jgi:hypothetical protein